MLLNMQYDKQEDLGCVRWCIFSCVGFYFWVCDGSNDMNVRIYRCLNTSHVRETVYSELLRVHERQAQEL